MKKKRFPEIWNQMVYFFEMAVKETEEGEERKKKNSVKENFYIRGMNIER